MSRKIYRAEDIDRIVYFGEFRGIEKKDLMQEKFPTYLANAAYVYGKLIYQNGTYYILMEGEGGTDPERMIKVIPSTVERRTGWERYFDYDEADEA